MAENKKEEKRYKQLANATFEGILIHDYGTILEVNTVLVKLLEFEKEADILYKNVLEFFPKELNDFINKKICSASHEHYETQIITRTGNIIEAEIQSRPFSDGKKLTRVVAVRDITTRKKAEKALEESEKKYRAIFENMIDAFYRTDLEGNITLVSPTAPQMFGYNKVEEVVGKNVARDFYLVPEARNKFLKNLLEQKKLKSYPLLLKRADGSAFHVETTSYLIYDDNGNTSGIEGILRDVTAQTKSRQDLIIANQELKMSNCELKKTLDQLKSTQSQLIEFEKMATLGQLTAGIAHEINNPINFISSNINPLERDFSDLKNLLNIVDETIENKQLKNLFEEFEQEKENIDIYALLDEIEALIKGIKEGALRTKEIVNGLKNYSRLDEVEFIKADINKGLESTLLLLKNKTKNRIEIQRDYGELPEIECLPGKLNQVFMNILSNAIQAIDDKGEIHIKTRFSDNSIKIHIRDTGKGMSEDTKERIFEPFFTTKAVGVGTGLGLSISKKIIEKHAGTITVESEIGKGAEFIIQIPVPLNQ